MSNIRLTVRALVAAIVLIGGFEGYRQVTYKDKLAHDLPTACFGSTRGVKLNHEYRPEECAGMIAGDVLEAARVLDCFTVELTENQQVAVTSWAYNVGVKAACGSTLVRLANAGEPATVWCEQLMRWRNAGGKEVAGLTRRRAEERALCLQGAR
jgi:lysozyme